MAQPLSCYTGIQIYLDFLDFGPRWPKLACPE
jgi:hypothetical protein